MANFFEALLHTLGVPQQSLMQNTPSGSPLDPYSVGPGNGGGIVATPEQIAQSETAARALGIPMDTPAPEVPGQPIVVTGARPADAPVDPRAVDPSQYLLDSPVSLNNTAWAQEAQAARESNDKGVKHKGMFGMK